MNNYVLINGLIQEKWNSKIGNEVNNTSLLY